MPARRSSGPSGEGGVASVNINCGFLSFLAGPKGVLGMALVRWSSSVCLRLQLAGASLSGMGRGRLEDDGGERAINPDTHTRSPPQLLGVVLGRKLKIRKK